MKFCRSLFPPIIFGSLLSLNLLALGMPTSSFAETPHFCQNVTPRVHMGSHLGSLDSNGNMTFFFETDCPNASMVIAMQAFVYGFLNNTLICNTAKISTVDSGGNPIDTNTSLTCGAGAGTPALPSMLKIKINYWNTGGFMMVHENTTAFYIP